MLSEMKFRNAGKKLSSFFIISLCTLFLMLCASVLRAQTVIQTWDFETTLADWVAGNEASSIELSSEQAASGTYSVKLVKPATGLEINLQNDVYDDVQEGDVIQLKVWISATDLADVDGAQIFWQTGEGWSWNSQWVNGTSLTGDAWTTIEHTFPAIATPFQRLGLQLLLTTGNEAKTPTLYVDDITISRAAKGFTIVVDGEKDEWYNTLTGPDDGYLQLHFYHGNNNGVARNDIDLSAKMWAAWDSTWFYFYTEVKDDTLSGSGANSWEDDGLELKIDPHPTDGTQNNNTIFPPNLTIPAGSDSLNNIADSMKQFARRITSDGYALELAIKWPALSILDEDVNVAVDSIFGLGINIHDNDRLVGGGRVATVQWATIMNDNIWNTPASLGTAKFLPDNKIQFIPRNNITGVENPLPYDETPFYIHSDGQKDWVYAALENPSSQGPDNGYLQLRPYHGNDNGDPVNNADLSSGIWAMWDDEWLYLYSDVTDDTVSDGGTTNPWEVDNFELKFDPQATDSTQSGSGGSSPSIWDTRVTAPGLTVIDTLNNVADSLKKIVRRARTGGYAFEIAIKWSAIQSSNGETVSVGVDSIFGLAINQHDNDGNGRQASEMWGAVLLDAAWNTPKYLGTVKFLPDFRLQFIPENNMTGVRNDLPYDGTVPVDVDDDPSSVPTEYSLSQNYPNPFNPVTTIRYDIPKETHVTLAIYDILGQKVAELVNELKVTGRYQTIWNASSLSSGIYFYRIEAGDYVNVKKLMLMK